MKIYIPDSGILRTVVLSFPSKMTKGVIFISVGDKNNMKFDLHLYDRWSPTEIL